MSRFSNDKFRSYADAVASSLMVGFGETYLAPFTLAVGLGQLAAGLVGSVPLVVGGFLQLGAPSLLRRIGSLKRWTVTCAALQGLAFLPLAFRSWQGQVTRQEVFAVSTIYWTMGLAASPAWNNWIDHLIPKRQMGAFLAVRSRLTQLAALVAFWLAGSILSQASERGNALFGFSFVFALAAVSRLASAWTLGRHTDVPVEKALGSRVPMRQVFGRFLDKGAGNFLFFLLMSQIAVNLGGSFFSPYMLAHVGVSYGAYAIIAGTSYVAKIVFYPWIGRFVQRAGAYRALWISGIAVAPPPLFWLMTPSLTPLVLLQIYAGVAWGTFELASAILVFDRIRADERLQILTVYNLLNALAQVIGALTGGLVLESLPKGAAYQVIFVASALARVAALLALIGTRAIKARVRNLRPLAEVARGRTALRQRKAS